MLRCVRAWAAARSSLQALCARWAGGRGGRFGSGPSPGLDRVLADVAKVQEEWAGRQLDILTSQALEPIRRITDEITKKQMSWAVPLEELARRALLPEISSLAVPQSTGLEKVFADIARVVSGPQSSYWTSIQVESFIRQIDRHPHHVRLPGGARGTL
ncbi:hypothetical protein OHV05_35670 (plasmid) [Kitasatospora sp. NBC_00070]|uniref:hypothetical protein n=1 Tax=Kitasatospora sp. NBC_00070 TaxID=2975962 RepID=UPI002F919995